MKQYVLWNKDWGYMVALPYPAVWSHDRDQAMRFGLRTVAQMARNCWPKYMVEIVEIDHEHVPLRGEILGRVQ